MIGTGTNSKSDTPLTLACSQVVHALTAMRARHGAESPIGHHCTNIMGQLAELETYVRPAWATDERQTLPYMIKQQIKALAALTATEILPLKSLGSVSHSKRKRR